MQNRVVTCPYWTVWLMVVSSLAVTSAWASSDKYSGCANCLTEQALQRLVSDAETQDVSERLTRLGLPQSRTREDRLKLGLEILSHEKQLRRYALLAARTESGTIWRVVLRYISDKWHPIGYVFHGAGEESRQATLLSHDELDWLHLSDPDDETGAFELIQLTPAGLKFSLRAGISCDIKTPSEESLGWISSKQPEIEDTWRGLELIVPITLHASARGEKGKETRYRFAQMRYAWDEFAGVFSPVVRQGEIPADALHELCDATPAQLDKQLMKSYWRSL